jgi:peroxiredoxin
MPLPSDTVPVGSPAPDFELTGTDGKPVRLSEFRGSPVVLVFLRGFR